MATDQNEQGGGATSSRMGPMPGFSARSRKASCGGSSTRSATSKPNRSATSSWLDRHAGRLPPQRRLRGCRPRYPPPSGTGRRQRPAVRRAGPEPARAMARPACGTVPFTTMPPRLPTSMPPPSGTGRRQRPAVRRAGPEPARAMARPARAGWLPSPRCLRGCRPRCSPTVRRRPAAAAGRPAGRARA